jgi:capsular polysaccharide export protein
MSAPQSGFEPAGEIPAKLFHASFSFLTDARIRRILSLAGHSLHLGLPGANDGMVVWGRSPTAYRGEWIAARRNVPLIRIEDAFLRSIHPGRSGTPPMGLLIDVEGVHFDSASPSMVERILQTHPLNDPHLMQRAADGMSRLKAGDLSKYNAHDLNLPAPEPGYVLVIDQTRQDASIRHSGASGQTFRHMLQAAQAENPGKRIVIKSHPETGLNLRPGHFDLSDVTDRISVLTDPVSPHLVLAGACAVYTVSSQLGFEAILAGHRPRVFGQPFYAGWGLSQDENPPPRRSRMLTPVQLFAATMILAPVWYDPCRDRLCSFEDVLNQLEADVRAFREDRTGHVGFGMRAWKRPWVQAFFGREKPVIFARDAVQAVALARKTGRDLLLWGTTAVANTQGVVVRRIEDGFLRSRGLGAELVPALGLMVDGLGLYFDPSHPSAVEATLLAPLPDSALRRAEALQRALIAAGVTKYNLGGDMPDLPSGHRVLVVGQVQDDAGLTLGAIGPVKTNLGLLQAARAALPDAVLIWKPHPDVEAGLREGHVDEAVVKSLGAVVARQADPLALIAAVDEIWTLTSGLGLEALIREKPVTCLGVPFYSGWGLTRDLGPVPERRLFRPDGTPVPGQGIAALIHAALIAVPRYRDPISGLPCPVEVIIERLASGAKPERGALNRLLAKAQGALAGHSWIWRR